MFPEISTLERMNALVPNNPIDLVYPATLPIEVALKTASIPNICAAYGLSKEDWNNLRLDPAFIADVRSAMNILKKEGMSFRMKARLQSEELLRTSWKLIHGGDDVPPSVKADLIKFTWRVAGYVEDKSTAGGVNNNLQINIDLR